MEINLQTNSTSCECEDGSTPCRTFLLPYLQILNPVSPSCTYRLRITIHKTSSRLQIIQTPCRESLSHCNTATLALFKAELCSTTTCCTTKFTSISLL
jgi:hypothetical protein